MMPSLPSNWRNLLSPGIVVLMVISFLTTAYVLIRTGRDTDGKVFWTFSRNHMFAYSPIVDEWNTRHPDKTVNLFLIDYHALQRRMLSGFLSGTPLADLIEVETQIAGRAFAGPLEAVGFVDLTERLEAEGLMDTINKPSFSPWTMQGRIFGIPHDVHPVLLAYRADLVEEAGIDMSQIETWADFERVCRPLMKDLDGDGHIDRYLINFWYTEGRFAEILIRQGDGHYFDGSGRLCLNDPVNVEIFTRLVLWLSGPGRIAIDARDMTAVGNRLLLEGQVVATMVPDWLVGVWKRDLPGLSGKMRLMPLPAWEPGGRRTSVSGGTMIGIPKASEHQEAAWIFAKELYTSPALAEDLFKEMSIISPIKSFWSKPFYDEPDPFFGGQPVGRLYINQAESVPDRISSPFLPMINGEVATMLFKAKQEVDRLGTNDPAVVRPIVEELLNEAQQRVTRQIERNVFQKVEGGSQ